jgi:hypothetical protein
VVVIAELYSKEAKKSIFSLILRPPINKYHYGPQSTPIQKTIKPGIDKK